MNHYSHYNLLKRAIVLFPRTAYTDDAAVRHARRKWVLAMEYLRRHVVSKWILDKPVKRLASYAARQMSSNYCQLQRSNDGL